MKFPFELSESRLSLLSPEDRIRYNYEHSSFFSVKERQKALLEYQNVLHNRTNFYMQQLDDDPEFAEILEKDETAEALAKIEMTVLFEQFTDIAEEFIQGGYITEQNWEDAKQMCVEYLLRPNALNESEGADMFAWEKGIKGIIASTIGVTFAGVVALFAAGKHRGAVKALKKYMARLVEVTDDGTYKEKSLFRKLLSTIGLVKKENLAVGGDQSTGCFRKIQENHLKQFALVGMNTLKSMGYLADETNMAISDVESNAFMNGGMNDFLKKIGEPLNKLANTIK